MTVIAASCARTPRQNPSVIRGTTAGIVAAVAVLLAACQENAALSRPRDVPEASGFDFFVLALSWSPSYCASQGEHANRQQCGSDTPYGFVVHGLWPQYENGYPSDCPTDRRLSVPRTLSDGMLDIMPSTGLIRHEWAKHGTCSGVSQEDYFTLTRLAFERIAIPDRYRTERDTRPVDPDSVETAFMSVNPGLSPDAVAVTCDRRYIRDVRICLTRDLGAFIACREVDDDGCAKDTAVMPSVR